MRASVHDDGSVGTVAGASCAGPRRERRRPAAARRWPWSDCSRAGLNGQRFGHRDRRGRVVSAAAELGYPVALKWDANVAHRARIGGVALGPQDRSRPSARPGGPSWRRPTSSESTATASSCRPWSKAASSSSSEVSATSSSGRSSFRPRRDPGRGGRPGRCGAGPAQRAQAESLIVSSPCAAAIQSRGRRPARPLGNRRRDPGSVGADRRPTVLAVDVNPSGRPATRGRGRGLQGHCRSGPAARRPPRPGSSSQNGA